MSDILQQESRLYWSHPNLTGFWFQFSVKLNSEWPGELLSQVPRGWYPSLQCLFTFLGWVLRYSGIYFQGVEWRWCWCHWAVVWMALMACVQRPAWHMVPERRAVFTRWEDPPPGMTSSIRSYIPWALSCVLLSCIIHKGWDIRSLIKAAQFLFKSHQNINSGRARTVSLGFTSVSLEPAQCQTQIRYLIPFPHHPCCRNPTLNWT